MDMRRAILIPVAIVLSLMHHLIILGSKCYKLFYLPEKWKLILLQPLDRDEPNGRPQWRFTVFAQDEGGNGLVGYADVQVNLKDINDNAPLFPQGKQTFRKLN